MRPGSAAAASAKAWVMVAVLSSRLDRSARRYPFVHGRGRIGVPARLTTASTSPSSVSSIRRCCGSQRCSSAVRERLEAGQFQGELGLA